MSRFIFKEEGTPPDTPPTGYVYLYAKSDGNMYQKDDAGIERGLFTADNESKSLMIEQPQNNEDLSLFFTDVEITLYKIRSILTGSTPSVTWTLRYGPDRSGVGTEVITGGTVSTATTTGVDITAFDNAVIPANSHVWFETTATGGTVTTFNMTVFYAE